MKVLLQLPDETMRSLNCVVGQVRSDKRIGRGSCSTVDECQTDDELIASYIEWLIDTAPQGKPAAFVRWLKTVEGIRQDRAEDIRNA